MRTDSDLQILVSLRQPQNEIFKAEEIWRIPVTLAKEGDMMGNREKRDL